jgi:hypothetical protein
MFWASCQCLALIMGSRARQGCGGVLARFLSEVFSIWMGNRRAPGVGRWGL